MLVAVALTASAEPLWVEPARVDDVRAAAVELWPGGPLEVAERPPVPSDGFLWDGATLAWITGGRAWTEPAPDAATVVLLARAWLADPPGGGTWVPTVEVTPSPLPEPAVRAPSVPPRPGAELVLDLGLRSVLGALVPDGVRIGAGAIWPHVDLDVVAFVSTSPFARTSELEEILAQRHGVATVTPVDVATVAGVAGWDLGVPRRAPRRWTAAPVVLGGVQLGEVAERWVSRDVVAIQEAQRFEIAALAGIAAEAWCGTAVGVRASAVDRVARRRRLDGDRGLDQRVLVAVDLRVVP